MVQELADESRSRRVGRVVGIVGAELWFGDEADRSFIEWVLGIENAAGCTKLGQHGNEFVINVAETVNAVEDTSELGWACRCGRRTRCCCRTPRTSWGLCGTIRATSVALTIASAPAITAPRAALLGHSHRRRTQHGSTNSQAAKHLSPANRTSPEGPVLCGISLGILFRCVVIVAGHAGVHSCLVSCNKQTISHASRRQHRDKIMTRPDERPALRTRIAVRTAPVSVHPAREHGRPEISHG